MDSISIVRSSIQDRNVSLNDVTSFPSLLQLKCLLIDQSTGSMKVVSNLKCDYLDQNLTFSWLYSGTFLTSIFPFPKNRNPNVPFQSNVMDEIVFPSKISSYWMLTINDWRHVNITRSGVLQWTSNFLLLLRQSDNERTALLCLTIPEKGNS